MFEMGLVDEEAEDDYVHEDEVEGEEYAADDEII